MVVRFKTKNTGKFTIMQSEKLLTTLGATTTDIPAFWWNVQTGKISVQQSVASLASGKSSI